MTDKSLGTYINPFTDFGFKKIFGSEESKPLLISFLNDLLPIENKIVSLEFKNIEKLGMLEEDRRAVFDIYCRDEKDQEFIVELQRAKQEHFQDRAAYYSSFLIQDQAKKGKWDFELTPIYFIGILDFSLASFPDENYLHFGQITDIVSQKVMFKKLNFIYIEMAKFKKQESELANHLESWLYFLRELVIFDEIPNKFKGDVIENAFHLAELANMSYEDRHAYELSLKYYRDFINVVDTAKSDGIEIGIEIGIEKGIEKGIEQGKMLEKIEMAKAMLQKGFEIEVISQITGLSAEIISMNGQDNR
jgi:predicted transposase/invertase (TIGR01784 family)